jgi:hypothetical protein
MSRFVRSSRSLLAATLALGTLLAPAHAASLEENFRTFIGRLKADGKFQMPQWGAAGVPLVTTPSIELRTDTLPLGRNQYVLFVANGCQPCAGVPERVRKMGLGEVIVMNLSTNATAREAFALTKAKGVPALLSTKRIMSGYSDAMMERLVIDETTDPTLNPGGA